MVAGDALTSLVERFATDDPCAVARALETMDDRSAAEAVRDLPTAVSVLVLPHLQVSFAAQLLEGATPEMFEAIIPGFDAKRAASLLMHMSPDSLERLLPHTPANMRNEVRSLLAYPEDSVGRMMLTNHLTFREHERVSDAIRKIRRLAASRMPASYGYVLDDHERLVGVLNMRDLLLASEEAELGTVMTRDVFTLNCFMDRTEAADQLSKRRFFAAPVVDEENRLLGIAKAENLMHGAQEDIAESIQMMFGGSPDERAFSSIWFSLKKRLPWLHVNLGTAFLAAYVVSLFQDTIAQITVLAVFLPVVAGQGGNAGAQSLAIVMRGLVMRELTNKRVGVLIAKEGLLGLITGTITGLVTGVIAWIWQGNPMLGVVIGLGMIVNLVTAGLSGAGIPLLMRSLGFDPAQCSNIILTTVTDVVGFLAFLGFAVLFQSYLV